MAKATGLRKPVKLDIRLLRNDVLMTHDVRMVPKGATGSLDRAFFYERDGTVWEVRIYLEEENNRGQEPVIPLSTVKVVHETQRP
jgi:hypothetical protein